MFEALLDGFDVAVHHCGGGVHAQFVRRAVYLQPFVHAVLAEADDVADLVRENFGAGAGDGIQAGVPQAANTVGDGHPRDVRHVDDLRGGQAVLVD